jgi:two-component system response regulator FixJ
MANEQIVHVVDDDEAVRESLRFVLEAEGLQVATYASAGRFLEAAPRMAAGCVLVDIRMPGMSGLELQDRLVADGFPLPVIIMTGHGEVPIAVRAMKAGAVDFIEKPFDDEILLANIRRALALGPRRQGEAARAAARLALLTERQRDVLDGLVAGQSNKAIAAGLGISPRTVEVHRARIMEKLGARSVPDIMRLALAAGIGV